MPKPLSQRQRFTVTITEADRKKAGCFTSNCDCLIATAIKRMGAESVSEVVDYCNIDEHLFTHAPIGPEELFRNSSAKNRPFYGPEVVGKKIVFTRAK